MSSVSKKSNGFTLIELLIVLTILVALTLTGTYKYFNIIEINKQKIDISNANILAEAVNVAVATGQIELTSKTSTIQCADLQNVLNKELFPTSKLYSSSEDNPQFEISVAKNTNNDIEVTVKANGLELYPVPETHS